MAYEACRDVMEALRSKYSGPLQARAAAPLPLPLDVPGLCIPLRLRCCSLRLPAFAGTRLRATQLPLTFPLCARSPQVLDHFMTEVGQRFATRTEERLLAVVYTLQQRTYKTGLPAGAPVPEVFKKELAGGCWGRCLGGRLVGWLVA